MFEGGLESCFPQISFLVANLLAAMAVEWFTFSDVTRSEDSN